MTVGPFGLLQPIADGMKLLSKETIIPTNANKPVFLLAPVLDVYASASCLGGHSGWRRGWYWRISMSVYCTSSLFPHSAFMAWLWPGWASNSRYAFLGALRSASQMVSYEVSMGLVIVCVLLCTGSLNLTDIVMVHRPWWLQIMLCCPCWWFFWCRYWPKPTGRRLIWRKASRNYPAVLWLNILRCRSRCFSWANTPI